MIPFSQAYKTVLDSVKVKETEECPLSGSLGRVLSRDVVADRDLPPHDVSAMDGIACRRADLDGPLEAIETIGAGSVPQKKPGPGQCSRIMTGAMVPAGADTVVMFEHLEEKDGVIRVVKKSSAANIRYKGEDMRKGDLMLAAGTMIGPVETAVLASAGCDPVAVFRRPSVGVVATGDELVEPADTPRDAQIRNSNSYQLCAQVRRAGGDPRYYGIAKDTPEAIDTVLKTALDECDLILFSGGVSMGDFDFVPGILRKNGIDIHFEKVAVKPGKPTVFGTKGDTCFFGLPGNPVSTYVLFEMLVRPLMAGMMGGRFTPVEVAVTLAGTLKRKKTDRMEFRPVLFNNEGQAAGFDYHGSAHIHAYTRADGVVALEQGVDRIEAGTTVRVRLIR